MGDGLAVAQWTAQLRADDCSRCRSGAIGGDTRWMAVAITMDSGGVITMDGSNSGGQ
jgi:hypothetical protein